MPCLDPGGAAFYFYNGVYQTNLTHYGTASGTDTSAHQTLEDLRTIYLAHYQQDEIISPVADPPPPTYPGLNWRDSCLVAKLGYADASIFDNTITWGTKMVKSTAVRAHMPPKAGYRLCLFEQ